MATLPAEAIKAISHGRAIGLLFFAFFAVFWIMNGLPAMSGTGVWFTLGLAICITVIIVIAAIYFLRVARHIPGKTTEEGRKYGRKIGRIFGLVFGLEIVLIFLASIILSSFHLDTLITPVIALIVGLHFLPLSPLFHMPIYYVTGIILALLGTVALIVLVIGVSGTSSNFWQIIVSLGAALTLWGTSFVSIGQGLQMLREQATIIA